MIYTVWFAILTLSAFGYVFVQIINDTPMRVVVHSYIFYLSFVMPGIYMAIFLYKKFHNLILGAINILIPLFFIYMSGLRYNGGIDNQYESLFFISLYMVIFQIIAFFISLFLFKKREVKSKKKRDIVTTTVISTVVLLTVLYVTYRFFSIFDYTPPLISKAQTDIYNIKNSIILERQKRVVALGESSWINGLSRDTKILFDGNDTSHKLLAKGIRAGKSYGRWETSDTEAPYKNYKFYIENKRAIVFKYDSNTGTFDCLPYNKGKEKVFCKKLLNLR